MKYARYEYQGSIHHGIVQGDELAELDGPLLESPSQTGHRHALSSAKLLPPVEPGKVLCIGQNYLEHIKEIGGTPPQKPHHFFKPPTCLIGDGDPIIYPEQATRIDYEGELAVVIKTAMKDIPATEALQHVLGYSCFNDVTERDMVSQSLLNLSTAKGFDSFGPMGPYLATDLDPDNLHIRTFLNGEVMQDANTGECVFGLARLLEHLSHCLTLLPNDVVTTGTPKGIAPMKPGDLVEVDIQGIGRLTNKVVSAKEALI